MSHPPIGSATPAGSTLRGVVAALAGVALLAHLFFAWERAPWILIMDQVFFAWASHLTQRSWAVDVLIVQVLPSNTAKIVPILGCAMWLFLEQRRLGRSTAFFGHILIGSFLAMAAARVVQNVSAYRPRPLHNPDLTYQLPFGIEPTILEGWSSFPSDTSALAFSIAAGLFVVSRRVGVAVMLWTIIVVAFPRAYAGLHYPSDLLGGALIGLICTLTIAPPLLRAARARIAWTIPERWQSAVWTAAFLYLLQMSTMFDDLRFYGSYAKAVLGL